MALSDQNLTAHDVDAGDFFGHGVLHLNAWIHLNEIPLARFVIDEELDGACVRVVHFTGQFDRCIAKTINDLLLHAIARRLLDDLLVTALHGAVALMQMQHGAVFIGQNLHFDVLGLADEFFEEDRTIAESAFRLGLGFIEQFFEVFGLTHDAHAATTTPESRFDDEREADLLRRGDGFLAITHWLVRAFEDRHLDSAGYFACRRFIAHHVEDLRLRSDEDDPRVRTSLRKLGILRQEAVTGMNRIHALFLRQSDDAFDVQISSKRPFILVQFVSLIRLEAMRAKAVLLRINAHRFQPKFCSRPHHADGDFRAVRDHQFFDVADRGWGGWFLGHGWGWEMRAHSLAKSRGGKV